MNNHSELQPIVSVNESSRRQQNTYPSYTYVAAFAILGAIMAIPYGLSSRSVLLVTAPSDFLETPVTENAYEITPKHHGYSQIEKMATTNDMRSTLNSYFEVSTLMRNGISQSQNCIRTQDDQYCCFDSSGNADCIPICPQSGWDQFVKVIGFLSLILGILAYPAVIQASQQAAQNNSPGR